MIRVSRERSASGVDDEVRVERFVTTMLLLGGLLFAAGLLYVAWLVLGTR